ncbi:hypothetical protein HDV00_001784 [Rhizophlyctis rosea]|nr:hypothetical protein HDV00_001784 [Rhizophlyctis rosea]
MMQKLDLSSNPLTSLPLNFTNFTSLTHLNISDTQITTLPVSILAPPHLKVIKQNYSPQNPKRRTTSNQQTTQNPSPQVPTLRNMAANVLRSYGWGMDIDVDDLGGDDIDGGMLRCLELVQGVRACEVCGRAMSAADDNAKIIEAYHLIRLRKGTYWRTTVKAKISVERNMCSASCLTRHRTCVEDVARYWEVAIHGWTVMVLPVPVGERSCSCVGCVRLVGDCEKGRRERLDEEGEDDSEDEDEEGEEVLIWRVGEVRGQRERDSNVCSKGRRKF